MSLEVLSRGDDRPARSPVLLFVHGGFHGAWCWDEHFLPWFAGRGRQACAVSLRGHAQADDPEVDLDCTLADYVDDVAGVLASLGRPAVVIGHSMGGVVTQMCFNGGVPGIAGAVLLASSPLRPWPGVVWRILRRHPVDFVRGQVFGDTRSLRRAMSSFFFDEDLDPATRARHMARLTAEASLAELFARQPPNVATDEARPVLVVAGRDDWSIPARDHQWLRATYQADFAECPGAHDLMLSRHWEETALAIEGWVRARFAAG